MHDSFKIDQRAVLANGIGNNGMWNVDLFKRLETELVCRVVDPELQKRHFFSAYWGYKKDARILLNMSRFGDIGIGHSYGCPRLAEAARYHYYSKLFLFRPAMPKNWDWSYLDPRTEVYCFHGKADWAIRLGSRLPWHVFGRAGVNGFVTERSKVWNVHTDGGHNADFENSQWDENYAFVKSVLLGKPDILSDRLRHAFVEASTGERFAGSSH